MRCSSSAGTDHFLTVPSLEPVYTDAPSGANAMAMISSTCPPSAVVGSVGASEVSSSSKDGGFAPAASSSSSLSRNDFCFLRRARLLPGSATPLGSSARSSCNGSAAKSVNAPSLSAAASQVPSGDTPRVDSAPRPTSTFARRSPGASRGATSGAAASSGMSVHPSQLAYSLAVGLGVALSEDKKPSLDHSVHGPQQALQQDHLKAEPHGAQPASLAGEDSRGSAPDRVLGSSSSSESDAAPDLGFGTPFSLFSSSSPSLASSEEPEGFFLGLSWSLGNTPMGEQSFGQSSGSRGSASGSPCIFRRMSLPVWQHVWPGRSTPPALGCSNEKDISPVRARRANERCGPDACVVTTEISRPFRQFQRLCRLFVRAPGTKTRARQPVENGTEVPRVRPGLGASVGVPRTRAAQREARVCGARRRVVPTGARA